VGVIESGTVGRKGEVAHGDAGSLRTVRDDLIIQVGALSTLFGRTGIMTARIWPVTSLLALILTLSYTVRAPLQTNAETKRARVSAPLPQRQQFALQADQVMLSPALSTVSE